MVQFFNDNFTAANGTSISARNSDSGHAWAFHTTSGGGNFLIQSNRAYPNAAASLMNVNVTPGTSEYDVVCGFHYLDSTSQVGFGGRQDTTNATMYYVMHTAGQFNLMKLSGGTPSNLSAVNYALSAGNQVEVTLEIRNASKRVLVDGVEIINVSDNTITGTGRVGIRAPAAGSTTAGKHFEYLRGIDLLPDITYHSYSDSDTITSVDTMSRAAFSTITDTPTITRTESYSSSRVSTHSDSDTITRTEVISVITNLLRDDVGTVTEVSAMLSMFTTATRTDTDSVGVAENIGMVSNFPQVLNEFYEAEILARSHLIHQRAARLLDNPTITYIHKGIFQGQLAGGTPLGQFELGKDVLSSVAPDVDDITTFVVMDVFHTPRYVGQAISDWNEGVVTLSMSENIDQYIPQLALLGISIESRG